MAGVFLWDHHIFRWFVDEGRYLYCMKCTLPVGCVYRDRVASDGGLFVYNILPGLHVSLPIVKEAIFRYNVTSIYGKIIGNCERIDVPLTRYYMKPRKG